MTEREIGLERVLAELASLPFERSDEAAFTVLRLPPVEGDDYRFAVYVYTDGEPQLAAEANSRDAREEALWSLPFERCDYQSLPLMWDAFLDALRAVLAHPTRIVRDGGPLMTSVVCEYGGVGGWKKLGGVSWLNSAAPSGWKRMGDRKTLMSSRRLPTS